MTPGQTALNDHYTQLIAHHTAVSAAILALTTGGVASYSLDTGQTVQQVTKLNLPALTGIAQKLASQIAVMDARLYGAGRTVGGPAW